MTDYQDNISNQKKKIRKEIRLLTNKLSKRQYYIESQNIIKQILNTNLWREAKTVLAFSPLHDEPDITPLIANAQHKTILLPVIQDDTLVVKKLNSMTSLVKEKHFGVLEPTGNIFSDLNQIDLIIIPGVAFTKEGKRLGRGKGYYDKFLKQLSCPFVGICFSYQLLDDIPIEEHDVILSHIISG